MGYSNVAGDLNVAATTTLSTLVVNGSTQHYGPVSSTSNAYFSNLVANTLTVTGNFIVTATNTSVSNALSIVNQGSATALYVNQNESAIHTHNVAEFYDHTTIAMIIDPHGNVAIHQTSSPGYALSVVDGVSMDVLTLGTPLSISSGGTGTATGAPPNQVFAGPSIGSAGPPLFRSLVNADLPSPLNAPNIVASVANVGVLNVLQVSNLQSLTTNLFASVANVGVLNVLQVANLQNLTTNLFAPVANVTTLNVFQISNLQSLTTNLFAPVANVTTLNVLQIANLQSLTTNLFASVANVGVLNVLQVANLASLTTNLVAPLATITTLNVSGTANIANIFTTNVVALGTSLVVTGVTVNGNVYVSNTSTAANGFLSTGAFGGVYADGIVMDYVNGNGRLSVGPNDNLTFFAGGPGGIATVTITSNSQVGIGTFTPSANLQVQGNVWASNALTAPSVLVTTANVSTLNVVGISNLQSLTTNLFASQANVTTLNVLQISNLASLTTNLFAPVANVTTLNVVGISNLQSLTTNLIASVANVTTLNVVGISNLQSLTTNLFVPVANVTTLNVIQVANLQSLTTNLFAPVANVTTLNVVSVANLASLTTNIQAQYANVTTNLWAPNIYSAGFTSNATNIVFNFDTLNIPYVNAGVGFFGPLAGANTVTYSEDLTRRAPHIVPSVANSATIRGWLAATANVTSQQSSFWAPSTRPTFSNVTNGPRGAWAYSGSVVLPDQRVIFVSNAASNIGVFNAVTELFTEVFPSGGRITASFSGGVLAPSGNIVCVPFNNSNVGIFNPWTFTYSNGYQHWCPAGAFRGAVLDGASNVTMIPWNSLNVSSYNGSTGLFSNMIQAWVSSPGYMGGVLLPTGNVFLVPGLGSNISLYSPSALAVSNTSLWGGFAGGVLSPDGNVVCIPGATQANALVVNPYGVPPWPTTNVFMGAGGYMGGVLLPNGSVACIPSTNANVAVLNPVSFTFSNLAPQGTSGGYAGGSLVSDGRVVMCPALATNVAVLTTTTPVYSQERVLAPYFNKF